MVDLFFEIKLYVKPIISQIVNIGEVIK